MKLIYSHENSIVAGNIRNLLELERIDVIVKNEFANGAVGDLSAFDAWIELWVDDAQEAKAAQIVQQAIAEQKNQHQQSDWFCHHCKEANGYNFEVCWSCQEEKQ